MSFIAGDDDMTVSECGDLRQMGDDDDLGRASKSCEPPADLDRGPPPDSSVHLVEHERGDGAGAREDDLEGQHDPGELTSGRSLVEGPWPARGVRGEQELDLVDSRGPERNPAIGHLQCRRVLRCRLLLPHLHAEPRVRHRQRAEFDGHSLAECGGRSLTQPGEFQSPVSQSHPQLAATLLQLLEPTVVIADGPEALARIRSPREDLIDRRPVSPPQRSERTAPGLDHIESTRIRIHRGTVGGEIVRGVRQQRLCLAQAYDECREFRVVPAHGIHAVNGTGHEGQRIKVLRVGEPLGFAGELGILARLRAD